MVPTRRPYQETHGSIAERDEMSRTCSAFEISAAGRDAPPCQNKIGAYTPIVKIANPDPALPATETQNASFPRPYPCRALLVGPETPPRQCPQPVAGAGARHSRGGPLHHDQ